MALRPSAPLQTRQRARAACAAVFGWRSRVNAPFWFSPPRPAARVVMKSHYTQNCVPTKNGGAARSKNLTKQFRLIFLALNVRRLGVKRRDRARAEHCHHKRFPGLSCCGAKTFPRNPIRFDSVMAEMSRRRRRRVGFSQG